MNFSFKCINYRGLNVSRYENWGRVRKLLLQHASLPGLFPLIFTCSPSGHSPVLPTGSPQQTRLYGHFREVWRGPDGSRECPFHSDHGRGVAWRGRDRGQRCSPGRTDLQGNAFVGSAEERRRSTAEQHEPQHRSRKNVILVKSHKETTRKYSHFDYCTIWRIQGQKSKARLHVCERSRLSQKTQYLASILTDKLVQCRNINCAQGKRCLHSRWFFSWRSEFTWPWRRTLTKGNDLKCVFPWCPTRVRFCFLG